MQTIRRGPLLPPSTYVLFGCFGRDGRGRLRFRGVVLLYVGCGGGDSTPSLAGLITDRYRYQDKAKQADCR